jgi:hypothetical protein
MRKLSRGFYLYRNTFLSKLTLALLLFVVILPSGWGDDGKSSSEEAKFDIYVSGEKVGQEKFTIKRSADSIHSSSVLNFRDPGRRSQKIRIETELTMDTGYVPKAYSLDSNIDGQKVTISGTFVPGQANFEYKVNGIPRKRGLLVGDSFIVLDTNVFHHFAFVAQLFDLKADNSRSIEVIIPQELANGIIKVAEVGMEETSIRGKKRDLHHLTVDSGSLLIDLWMDSQKRLYKIALPARGIEVIRDR